MDHRAKADINTGNVVNSERRLAPATVTHRLPGQTVRVPVPFVVHVSWHRGNVDAPLEAVSNELSMGRAAQLHECKIDENCTMWWME